MERIVEDIMLDIYSTLKILLDEVMVSISKCKACIGAQRTYNNTEQRGGWGAPPLKMKW